MAITANTGTFNWNTNAAWVGGVQPSQTDDVIIPTGAIITIPTATTVVSKALNVTGTGTIVFATSTSQLNAAGSVTIASTTTVTLTTGQIGTISYVGSSGSPTIIVTSNGKTMPNMTIGMNTGQTLQLADAFTSSGTITLTQGIFDTQNFSINALAFSSSVSNIRTATFGSSAMVFSSAVAWSASTVTNFTVTANTAVVTLSGVSAQFQAGNKNWNGLSIIITGSGTSICTGAFTVANLTRTGTAVKTDGITFNATTIITGTLTLNGNSTTNRILVASSATGTARSISAAVVSASNVDFTDIAASGAASWNLSVITGGSGDATGNSGITFTTAATQYARTSGTWSGGSTRWSLTSGGGATGRTPLPQDDVVIDVNTPSGTITIDMPRSGKSLDSSTAPATTTIASSTASIFYGSTFTFGSLHACTVNSAITLSYRGTVTVTSAGKVLSSNNLTGGSATTAIVLADALSIGTLSITGGSFDSAGYAITVSATTGLSFNGSSTKIVDFRTSTVTFTNTALLNIITGSLTGSTFSFASASFVITGTGAATRTLANMSGLSLGALTYSVGNTSFLLITLDVTIGALHIANGGSFTKNVRLTSGVNLTIGVWDVTGNGTNALTIDTATSGTQATITKIDTNAFLKNTTLKDINFVHSDTTKEWLDVSGNVYTSNVTGVNTRQGLPKRWNGSAWVETPTKKFIGGVWTHRPNKVLVSGSWTKA